MCGAGVGVLSPSRASRQGHVGVLLASAHQGLPWEGRSSCPRWPAKQLSIFFLSLAGLFPPSLSPHYQAPLAVQPPLPSGAVPGAGGQHITPVPREWDPHGPHAAGWLPVHPMASAASKR